MHYHIKAPIRFSCQSGILECGGLHNQVPVPGVGTGAAESLSRHDRSTCTLGQHALLYHSFCRLFLHQLSKCTSSSHAHGSCSFPINFVSAGRHPELYIGQDRLCSAAIDNNMYCSLAYTLRGNQELANHPPAVKISSIPAAYHLPKQMILGTSSLSLAYL